MDYKYLVESGQYSRDDLNDAQNAFIDGLDQSLTSAKELLGMIQDDFGEQPSMLVKIKLEEMESFVNEFEDYIDSVICEHIVVFADNNIAEEEKQQPAKDYSRQPRGYQEPSQNHRENHEEEYPEEYQDNYQEESQGNYSNEYPEEYRGGYREKQPQKLSRSRYGNNPRKGGGRY
jgi:hypothetical protein